MKIITFQIPYFDSFLRYKGQIISDEGNYLMVKVITNCDMQGMTTAVYKDQIIT